MVHNLFAVDFLAHVDYLEDIMSFVDSSPKIKDGDSINMWLYNENPDWDRSKGKGSPPIYAFRKKLKTINLIVGGVEPFCEELLTQLGINISTWPTYFFNKTVRDIKEYNNPSLYRNVFPSKHFICMNNIPRYHRCHFMDQLVKRGLDIYGEISWHLLFTMDGFRFKYWKPKIQKFSSQKYREEDSDINYDKMYLPNEWHSTAFNVILETDVDKCFITEKVTLPLLLGKPFITLGSKGFYKRLEDLGFKLYDIFDYSFDEESKIFHRVDALLDTIQRVVKFTPQEIYEACKSTAEYNKNIAYKIANDESLIPTLVKEHQMDWYCKQ